MATEKIPEGSVLRDDGCICPVDEKSLKPCKPGHKIETCPYDPRFPNQNQTRHCYVSFLDFQRCARLLGDYPGCKIFYICYNSLCPSQWWERWYDQMERGIFPAKIYPPKPIIRPDPEKIASLCLEEEETPPPPEDVC